MRALNLEGSTYGRLKVLGRAPKTDIKVKWLCVCECGKTCTPTTNALTCGNTRSCGCLQIDRVTVHGHASTGMSREYMSWLAMKARCSDPNAKGYRFYGGRGISVCERWQSSFPNFLLDMGPRPHGKTLDRFPDQNGNYEPGNCRWATQQEQSDNQRRRATLLTYGGTTKTLATWAKDLGVKPTVVMDRVRRGWDLGKALTTPMRVQVQ